MLDTSRIYTSRNYGKFRIINYTNKSNVTVEFIDTGYITRTGSCSIVIGLVKDRLYRSVYGVGFFGEGHYRSSKNRKTTRSYRTWKTMLARCYSKERQEAQPTYKGCTVCDEWHNFQNFAKWHDENYTEGLHLDKDIKREGNKIYSPETCLFVTHEENTTQATSKMFYARNLKGEKIKIYNLSEFCRRNSIDYQKMRSLCSGKLEKYKKWRRI